MWFVRAVDETMILDSPLLKEVVYTLAELCRNRCIICVSGALQKHVCFRGSPLWFATTDDQVDVLDSRLKEVA